MGHAGQVLAWVGILCERFEHIPKPNGSLYFFASADGGVECEIGQAVCGFEPSLAQRPEGEAGKPPAWQMYGPENLVLGLAFLSDHLRGALRRGQHGKG